MKRLLLISGILLCSLPAWGQIAITVNPASPQQTWAASTGHTAGDTGTITVTVFSCKMFAGVGSPETVVTANPCSTYLNSSGGANTTFYVKESGAGNTGWIPK